MLEAANDGFLPMIMVAVTTKSPVRQVSSVSSTSSSKLLRRHAFATWPLQRPLSQKCWPSFRTIRLIPLITAWSNMVCQSCFENHHIANGETLQQKPRNTLLQAMLIDQWLIRWIDEVSRNSKSLLHIAIAIHETACISHANDLAECLRTAITPQLTRTKFALFLSR